jgi:hypothetical protein
MSKFAYFTFTCGTYTTGRGHARFTYEDNRTSSVEGYIYRHLSDGGEKNCKIIIERLNSVEDGGEGWIQGRNHVSYQIKERWYSHIPAILGAAATFGPIVMNMISKKSD